MDIIRQKNVLAVEGKDEVEFFKALLKHVGITEIEPIDVGGKDKFKTKFPALVRRTGFLDVDVLAVIRDADNDAEGAFKSIRDILRKEGLEPPEDHNRFSHRKPQIGIFIMPGNSDTGMLEDLCLETVKNHPAMDCVNTFIACVSHLDATPGNLAKAKVQAFLAAMPNCSVHRHVAEKFLYITFLIIIK